MRRLNTSAFLVMLRARRIREEVEFTTYEGLIREKREEDSPFQLSCPVVFAAFGSMRGTDQREAAKHIGLDREDADRLARVSDLRGLAVEKDRALRERVLVAVGLA